MAKRQNLVIVRAGNSSLHEEWLTGAEERNWDLIVNYFGDDPQRYRRDDVRVVGVCSGYVYMPCMRYTRLSQLLDYAKLSPFPLASI